MTPQQIIDAWNAQADEANQWGALGEDEKLMWAYKQAIAEAALARQDVQDEIDRGAKTLRETYLAQPEQEPDDLTIAYMSGVYDGKKLRTWVGLTADELNMIGDRMRTWNSHSLADVYVAIEAKLKEKNT